ncbi:hypothetical protein [Kribbella sp. NPDC050470]|uniref:hypothetical protein n=1 Tax=unclassified Kribbella TaxID=2644121 RepID=UPI0037A4C451
MRRAVDVLRHRPADEVAAKGLVAEFHELRALMSTMALLMTSFSLSRYARLIRPQRPTTAGVLTEADADLIAASDHLDQAAGRLTAARQKLDSLH